MNVRTVEKGDRVRLIDTKNILTEEYGHGEWMTIISIGGKEVGAHLDRWHEDLGQWSNCFVWAPEDIDDDTISLSEWLGQRVEFVDDCNHYFSHLECCLTGERWCTTCRRTIWPSEIIPILTYLKERWKLADATAESKLSAMGETTYVETRNVWDTIDGWTNHQLRKNLPSNATMPQLSTERKPSGEKPMSNYQKTTLLHAEQHQGTILVNVAVRSDSTIMIDAQPHFCLSQIPWEEVDALVVILMEAAAEAKKDDWQWHASQFQPGTRVAFNFGKDYDWGCSDKDDIPEGMDRTLRELGQLNGAYGVVTSVAVAESEGVNTYLNVEFFVEDSEPVMLEAISYRLLTIRK